MPVLAPATANEAINGTLEDHNWRHDPVHLNSTDGIRRAIEANRAAIQALADYIDGKTTDQMADGQPVVTERLPVERAPMRMQP